MAIVIRQLQMLDLFSGSTARGWYPFAFVGSRNGGVGIETDPITVEILP
jgi:hypothetical protein